MSVRQVTRRDPKTGASSKYFMVDVVFEHPDGRIERVRKVSPVQTRRSAEQHERNIRQDLVAGNLRTYGRKDDQKEVPTLATFSDEFIAVYAKVENKGGARSRRRSAFCAFISPRSSDAAGSTTSGRS